MSHYQNMEFPVKKSQGVIASNVTRVLSLFDLKGRRISNGELTALGFAWLIIPGGSLFLVAYFSLRLR